MDAPQRAIIFFDGVCGLCNMFIDFVMRHDGSGKFLFAALQGKAAAERLGKQPAELDPQSIVLLDMGKLFRSSTAVLHIVSQFGGVWKWARIFLMVPEPIRDGVYFFIAKNRYQWFGKRDTCRLPTEEERAKFLD